MADGNGQKSQPTSAPDPTPGGGAVPVVGPDAVAPLAALTAESVEASFRRDDAVRGALAQNLKRRGKSLKVATERAKAAFADFDPSRLSAEERSQSHYLAPGGDLHEALDRVIQEDVTAMRESGIERSISLHPSKELESMIEPAQGDDGLVGRIQVEDLSKITNKKLPSSFNFQTAYTQCEAEVEADRRMAAIDGPATGDGGGNGNGAGTPGAPAAEADALVMDQVNIQMATTSSPETKLQFNVPGRMDQGQVQESIKSLELRDGASDVTAFHDFSTLQIAFRDVWTEIFHGDLAPLGKWLYEEYVAIDPYTQRDPKYTSISSVPELKALMAEIRNLLSKAEDEVPSDGGFVGFLSNLFSGGNKEKEKPPATAQPDKTRLFTLLESLDKIVNSRYSFTSFVPDTINFGILITYRQTWEPLNYQVGELVSTIPLAPKEVRRYTTRQVTKKTRNVKELEDSLQTRRTESGETSRVDAEIVDKAQTKNTFNLTAHESIGGEGYTIDATQNQTGEASKESTRTKKEIRESVVKSAQEYKQQHRMEVDAGDSLELEETTFHEIQNPNDELAVTYLFYELQRQYEISERLHRLTPVVMVANRIPLPNEISDAWLLEHDWILRRVILDDSFRPAIDYLADSFVGAELNIRILEDDAISQKQLVDRIGREIQAQTRILTTDEQAVLTALSNVTGEQKRKGALDTVKRIFDPIGITGETDDSGVDAAQTTVDYAKETLDRAMKEKARLMSELDVATGALQAAVDKLASAIKEHYNRVAAIDRLRVHVKDNILYYMQAIWSHEPPDQRYFRIYDTEVPIVQPDTAGMQVDVHEKTSALGEKTLSASLPMTKVTTKMKKLYQVADLDTVLGFKGNYMIFALKENNYLTLHMMQDYLDVADEVVLRDPDEFGNYTIDDLQRLATCLKKKSQTAYNDHREAIRTAIIDRLTSGRADKEQIVVPTSSLYIECLVGTHPLLEDFKLAHRALDVRKVQAEVRHAELENIRLAARALKGKDDDPDVEKKIVIENGDGVVVGPVD